MKKICIIPALAIISLLGFSCNKKDEAPSAPAAIISAENVETVENSETWKTGHVLRIGSAVYTLESDTGSETDRTKWDAVMALGEKIQVGENRRLTFSGDGTVYDFVKVRRDDGKEVFAWASQVAAGGELAVVVDDRGNLFKSPRAVDVTGIILPRKTVGVRFPDTVRDGFVEVRAYDPAAQAYRQNFMRVSSLSRKESDIQSSILLQTAEPLGNTGAEKIRKDALLETALLDYPDSAFSADISALVNPNATAVIRTESVSRPFMAVNDDNVNVRDLPDPVAGRVLGQLNRNDEVTVIEQTASQSTVGGQSARWYRITEPLEGWVFGVYLE